MAHPKNAIPTRRGWVHERTGELLKSQRISPEFIAAWHNDHSAAPAPAPAPAPEPTPEPVWETHTPRTLHEAPAEERDLTEEEVAWNYDPEEGE